MLAIPVTFRFRDQRNYVQGSDLLNVCLSEISARYPLSEDGPVRLAAHKIINRQCTLYIYEPGAGSDAIEGAYVEFSAQTVAGTVRAFLVPTGDSVSERFAYDEERIEAASQIDGAEITLLSDTGFSPIEVAIALNKKLHNTLFPLKSERWIFTRIDLKRPFQAQDAQRIKIALQQKLGNKLSRSAIVVDGQAIGHIYFSAVPK